MENKIRTLLDAIHDLIEENSPYKEKYEAIIRACDGEDRNYLFEFISWFDAPEGE